MESSPIFATICKIKDKVRPLDFLNEQHETSLCDYILGINDIRSKTYISAEIRPDSLDKGSEPTALWCRSTVRSYGVYGDQAAQFIGKRLGGDGLPRNLFPMNAKLDRKKWKDDEDLVYAHVKKGHNRRARLMYGIKFNTFFEDEIARPYKIYYHFRLYVDEQAVGNPIEGVFDNTSPKLTNDDYYHDQFNRPHAYSGQFKVILLDE